MKLNETVVNIGIRERKNRLILGIFFLIAASVVTVFFMKADMNFWWGFILFPVWYQGIRFFLDYKTGTCPLKAELGQIKLDAFVSFSGKKIEDRERALKIRDRSRKAVFKAIAAAFFLTLLTIT